MNKPEPSSEKDTDLDERFPDTQSVGLEGFSPVKRIGPYRLLQRIGEGGMGTVWLADQVEPVRRRVAIKLIKSGLDSKQVIGRFEAERQALAMMDHQNIAKVLDAGITEDGLPYFAMEFVKGTPLNEYYDQNKLSIDERLELFIPVCEAVQHAHHKGVIHRDLKPSNILVSMQNDRPVPKVIDFGLAKATSQQLTDKTMFTAQGQVLGTLEYMSPEQADLNEHDIDTRSDIYSLGVILYELLTGTTPLKRETIRQAAFQEVLKRIKEEDPQRPSLRLSNSSDTLESISSLRRVQSRKFSTLLKGELDWIVMKAIEKNRLRRYDSATALARDIQNFLNDEPVKARPPSIGYQASKFIKRNRIAVASLAAVTTLCLLGVLALANAYRLSVKAEDLAKQNELQTAEYATQLKGAEDSAARSMKEFTETISKELSAARSMKDLTETISEALTSFNEIDTSQIPIKNNALLIRSRHESALMFVKLGLYLKWNNAVVEEQANWFLKSVDAFQKLRDEGLLERSSFVSYATAHEHAALALRDTDRERAIEFRKREVDVMEQLLGGSDIDQEFVHFRLGIAYQGLSFLDDAIGNETKAIDLLSSVDNPSSRIQRVLAKSLYNRAMETGDATAVADLIRAIKIMETQSSNDDLLSALDFMVIVQEELGNTEQVAIYLAKSNALAEQLLADGEGPMLKVANNFFNTGFERHKNEDFESAIDFYSRAAPLVKKLADANPEFKTRRVYYQTFWHRAEALCALNKYSEALDDYQTAINAVRHSKNPEEAGILPYLNARLIRCQAEADPVAAAKEIDAINRETQLRGEVLMVLASVYSLAAEAESENSIRSEWVERALEAIAKLNTLGLMTEDFSNELDSSPDFAFLRGTEEYGDYLEQSN